MLKADSAIQSSMFNVQGSRFPIPQFQHFSISAFQLFPAAPHSRFKVQGSRFEVQGSRFEVQGSRFEVRGSRFKVQGSRFNGSRFNGSTVQSSTVQGNLAPVGVLDGGRIVTAFSPWLWLVGRALTGFARSPFQSCSCIGEKITWYGADGGRSFNGRQAGCP